jgi:AbiV family abortive infection protein
MQALDQSELNALRLAIFDNAEALHREAKLLLDYAMYSRAYLLAHFCFEELGKIPIVVGVLARRLKGTAIDWKAVHKRFYSHEEKIASQNGHFYAFGLEADLIRDSDVDWLVEADSRVSRSFQQKNLATYVDVAGKKVLRPNEQISKEDAEKLVQFAFECLRAHWRSESLTNPIISRKSEKEDDAA